MLSNAQMEAAAKAIALSDGWSEDDWENSDGPPHHVIIRHAKAALIAAAKVRDQEVQQRVVDQELERRREAQTQSIHTCHADCPCQTGGKPVPDFIEARTQADDVGCCGGACGCKA